MLERRGEESKITSWGREKQEERDEPPPKKKKGKKKEEKNTQRQEDKKNQSIYTVKYNECNKHNEY